MTQPILIPGLMLFDQKLDIPNGYALPPGVLVPLMSVKLPGFSDIFFVFTAGHMTSAPQVTVTVVFQQVGVDSHGNPKSATALTQVLQVASGAQTINFSGVIGFDSTIMNSSLEISWQADALMAIAGPTITFNGIQRNNDGRWINQIFLAGSGFETNVDVPIRGDWHTVSTLNGLKSASVGLQDTTDGGNVAVIAHLGRITATSSNFPAKNYQIRARLSDRSLKPVGKLWPAWDDGVVAQQDMSWPDSPPMIVACLSRQTIANMGVVIELRADSVTGNPKGPSGLQVPRTSPTFPTHVSCFALQEWMASTTPGSLVLQQTFVAASDTTLPSWSKPQTLLQVSRNNSPPGVMQSVACAGTMFGASASRSQRAALLDEAGKLLASDTTTDFGGPLAVCASNRGTTHSGTVTAALSLAASGTNAILKANNSMALVAFFDPN